MTQTTLAFDVYGTLVDPHRLVPRLHRTFGERAQQISTTWREKQLEYSFRHALMGDPVSFEDCTRQALHFAAAQAGVTLEGVVADDILAAYRGLPAYPGTRAHLQDVAAAGHRVVAFSNGSPDVVTEVLESAGLRDCFADVVSVAPTGSFKPAPVVYQHLLRQTRSTVERTWMITSNSFDVLGARRAGLPAIWVRRSPEAQLDPWGVDPTAVVQDLGEIRGAIESAAAPRP